MIQITYKKKNGNTIQRLRNTKLPYKIGDTTSMGWKVLNIEYEHNDKYYSEYEYNRLIQTKKELYLKKKQTKEVFMNEFKTFVYLLITVFLIKMLMGI